MTDIQKVIRQLEQCNVFRDCLWDEYKKQNVIAVTIPEHLFDDVLELLKEKDKDADIVHRCRSGEVVKCLGNGVIILNYNWWQKILEKSGEFRPVPTYDELLKEQEPRVFSVSDFFGEEFGFLEYRKTNPGFSNFEPSPILIGDIDEEYVTVIFRSASVQKLSLSDLNKRWRIWSNYPTHELLRTVPWG